MRYAVKSKKKIVKAYRLGAGSQMEAQLIREGQAEGVYRPEYSAEDVTMLLLRGIRAVFFEWCSSGGEVDLTGECLWLLEVAERGFRV